MCGIAGICNIKGLVNNSIETLIRMTGILKHRGPDESGVYIDDLSGLGHARLSILDLSHGTQPIHNEDKTLWIVFNGEIFNYLELRQELVNEGHRFYTATDTEVIIHLYEKEGVHSLNRLNGQFAFAIWDAKQKELFLARDRVGICPLHYATANNCLYFASEIKSLLTNQEIPCEINPIALDQIFTFWTTLPGTTIFKNIKELPPGHYLRMTRERISVTKYWDFPLHRREEHFNLSPSEISEKLKALLSDAVRIRLQADVPVGSYLSGGLDSSGITAMVAKNFNSNIQTFGMHFEELDFDESPYQKNMAAFLDVKHKELFISNENIAENIAQTIWHSEKPTLRTAPIPLYLLSKLVNKNNFKVILTGEGADEIFGGYNIFKESLVRKFWSRQPDSQLRASLISQLYPNIFKNPKLNTPLIKFFRQGLDQSEDPLFSHLLRWNNTKRIKTFFSDDLKQTIGDYDGIEEVRQLLPENFHNYNCLSKAQYLESKIFLSNYLLSSQGDRVAMAHSVETRPPYLDHRIIEFMGYVPSVWKILGLNEKHVLKKTFRDILPKDIVSRPKTPYRAPIQQGLLSNPRPQFIDEALSAQKIQENGYFNSKKTAFLMKKLSATQNISEVDGMALAGILSTQLIDAQFVKNFPTPGCYRLKPDLIIDRRTNPAKSIKTTRD